MLGLFNVLYGYLSFIELDKAVVLVWLDWLVFCEYGFSVFALWCPLATPIILLGFLLPWAWGISSRLLQQSAAVAPYLGWGVSPHRRPSWPSMWDSSSRPSCTLTARAPGNSSRHRPWPRAWVAPPGRCLWPRAWRHGVAPPVGNSPSNEYSELISFRIDWFDLFAIQGTLKNLLQHHSSKASILWHSAFLIVQLSHPYMITGKP